MSQAWPKTTIRMTTVLLVAISLCFAVPMSIAAQQQGSAAATRPDAKSLKETYSAIFTAIKQDDIATAVRLTRAMLPDKASIAKVVNDSEAVEVIAKWHAELAKVPDDVLADSIKADAKRTRIVVHAATTEELIEYKQGSVAWSEFPGGVRAVAQKGILKPGVTFYEIELLEPGKSAGMRYHLFYHDGKAWKMLGPIWRAERNWGADPREPMPVPMKPTEPEGEDDEPDYDD